MADRLIIDKQQPPKMSVLKQQLFGPWTTYDPKVQQQIVRTQASSGLTQRRFTSTFPPAAVISQKLAAVSGGWQFAFRVVSGSTVVGYNIYKSTINNPNVATLLTYRSQPPIVQPGQSITIQDTDAGSPHYWVASVNSAGQESTRITVTGTAPAPNTSTSLPSGGGSGSGSGGGRGGGALNWKLRNL